MPRAAARRPPALLLEAARGASNPSAQLVMAQLLEVRRAAVVTVVGVGVRVEPVRVVVVVVVVVEAMEDVVWISGLLVS